MQRWDDGRRAQCERAEDRLEGAHRGWYCSSHGFCLGVVSTAGSRRAVLWSLSSGRETLKRKADRWAWPGRRFFQQIPGCWVGRWRLARAGLFSSLTAVSALPDRRAPPWQRCAPRSAGGRGLRLCTAWVELLAEDTVTSPSNARPLPPSPPLSSSQLLSSSFHSPSLHALFPRFPLFLQLPRPQQLWIRRSWKLRRSTPSRARCSSMAPPV